MNNNESILQKQFKSYFILVVAMLFVTAAFIMPSQLNTLNNSLEKTISDTANILSRNSEIIDGLKKGVLSDSLKDNLDEIVRNTDNIDYIVIADKNSVRLFHPDRTEIGKKFAGGDESQILIDPTPYFTTKKGAHNVQKRVFFQLADSDGTVLGFIMVSASLTTVRNAQIKLMTKLVLIFMGLTVIGMALATYTARHIRKSLLGYEPADIAKLFLQREEILENIDEGIIACNLASGKIFSNSAADKLFGSDYKPKEDEELGTMCNKCITENASFTLIPYEHDGKNLLISVMPLTKEKETIGTLLIFRDRTEVLELADQLSGSNHIVEALRASTHEFLNKLHIISGMLQMENYEQAIAFVDGLSEETRNSYQTIIGQIQNKTLAALLLGKQSHARELDIDFSIRKDSFLSAHNDYLSTKEMVTVIGNLIENAFHAVENIEGIRQVQLFVRQSEDGLTIITDDTGCGMTEEQTEELMNGNFTTRGEGHGIGFRLIREIVAKHDGYLSVDSEPNEGSSFTISIRKKRNGGKAHD